jgi:hypothetical protein
MKILNQPQTKFATDLMLPFLKLRWDHSVTIDDTAAFDLETIEWLHKQRAGPIEHRVLLGDFDRKQNSRCLNQKWQAGFTLKQKHCAEKYKRKILLFHQN